MNVNVFLKLIPSAFYAGVPDSQLRALCDCLMSVYGLDVRHHVITANEGNAVALAAGYHLATGKIPAVYMQNSGIGNAVNPIVSLMNDKVYGIPCVFIVGWRGEPGVHDEPQHVFQGEITLRLLEDMDVRTFVLSKETTIEELQTAMDGFRPLLTAGKQVAFVVRKGALTFDSEVVYRNDYEMTREEAIRHVARAANGEVIVSTTGKASRELFEIREANDEGHAHDFLTVGSMGHSSSIALGIASQRPQQRVWVIDGDGAALMHMGAMAVLGANRPANMVHIVINNMAHETVGGMPTVAGKIDLPAIAVACGYPHAMHASTIAELDAALAMAKAANELMLIEARCKIGTRVDLGRPTTTPQKNKRALMEVLDKVR